MFGESEGEPYWIYLTAGEHEIRFTATLDAFSEVLTGMDEVNRTLTQLYRRIVMVTAFRRTPTGIICWTRRFPAWMDSLTAAGMSWIDWPPNTRDHRRRNRAGFHCKSNITQLSDFLRIRTRFPPGFPTFQSNISSLSDWLIAVPASRWRSITCLFRRARRSRFNANASLLNSFRVRRKAVCRLLYP